MTDNSASLGTRLSKTDRPAIGVGVTGKDPEWVAVTLLRLRTLGFDAIVVPLTREPTESEQFARELDLTVLDRFPDVAGTTELNDQVRESARNEGYPGVILAVEGSQFDIEESVNRYESSEAYVVEATGRVTDYEAFSMVAIPAYNEAESIAEIVEEAKSYADSVLVVDDGSTDKTATIAEEVGAITVSHRRNKGYGEALNTIFHVAGTRGIEHLAVVDGDGQHDITDVQRMFSVLDDDEVNVVIGNRFDGSSDIPLFRRLGLSVINVTTNAVFRSIGSDRWISDTQSGFRAYDRQSISLLAEEERIGKGMEGSIDTLSHCVRHGLSVREIGTEISYDVANPNTHRSISHGLRLVRNIVRLIEVERPITFLGVPGLFSLAIGVGFGYWTSINYIETADFPIGLAITAMFFSLTGLFVIFTAVILHALADFHQLVTGADV
jgi:glycosyltransferase involved in cell wall biosynthesis